MSLFQGKISQFYPITLPPSPIYFMVFLLLNDFQHATMFIGRTEAEAETPLLWPPHLKSWLIGKDSEAGRDWGQEEKGTTEDEMAGWEHQLDAHEFGWTPGVSDGWEAWYTVIHGVAKSQTQLSDRTELNCVICFLWKNSDFPVSNIFSFLLRHTDLPLEKPVCKSGSNS